MRALSFSWLSLLFLVQIVAACEAAANGGGDDDVLGGVDLVDSSGFPPGTGPASACGNMRAGTWLEGAAYDSEGDDSLRLTVNSQETRLDLAARFQGETWLLVNVEPDAGTQVIIPVGDGTQFFIRTLAHDEGRASGYIFNRNGFGGDFIEGHLCFDAPPAVGQTSTGSYAFLITLGEERLLHRVQGSFQVPGEAVLRADTFEGRLSAVEIAAGVGATVTID